jgi:adenine phosphoribosyltransferase
VVGSQSIEIPVVALHDDLAIALLITVDHGIRFAERAGADLADVLRPYDVDLVVSVATMGIPLAIEVSRSLGLDDYLILHKTPKIHLGDSLAEPLTSITTDGRQHLRMDPARVGAVAGRRVALVDDVVSTGASVRAALSLLRRVGAHPVVVGTLVTEGSSWAGTLGADADLVRPLGAIPVFRPGPAGTWVEDWGS